MLDAKILGKTAKIAIIGLGYVGLPLAVEFSKAGLRTIGIDLDKTKVENINNRLPHVLDVTADDLKNANLSATTDFNHLQGADVSIICVPTPLTERKEPDLSYVVAATRKVAEYLQNGQLVALESTSYPGTTRHVVLPILETSGLRVGKDFYLVCSPERLDPGNRTYGVKNIPKLVGGMTADCTAMGRLLYSQVCDEVIVVSSPEIAEMAKLFENSFRSVNIALVNEVAMLCERMNIDTKEILDAAATKPYGFMSFYPGPGVGGHCIPVDPLYLSWIGKKLGSRMRLIELSDRINSLMPHYTVSKIEHALNEHGKNIGNAAILILGVTYKRDTNDTRESPALEIMGLLQRKGATVHYNDPFIGQIEVNGNLIGSIELSEGLLRESDCVVIATDHSRYDYKWIARNSNILIDPRKACQGLPR